LKMGKSCYLVVVTVDFCCSPFFVFKRLWVDD
jgi:hypothetical protein